MLNFNLFKIWDYYLFGYEEESREIIFRKWQTPFIFFRWKEIRISFEVIGRKLRFDPTHFSNNLPNDRFNKTWTDVCHSMIRPILNKKNKICPKSQLFENKGHFVFLECTLFSTIAHRGQFELQNYYNMHHIFQHC